MQEIEAAGAFLKWLVHQHEEGEVRASISFRSGKPNRKLIKSRSQMKTWSLS